MIWWFNNKLTRLNKLAKDKFLQKDFNDAELEIFVIQTMPLCMFAGLETGVRNHWQKKSAWRKLKKIWFEETRVFQTDCK